MRILPLVTALGLVAISAGGAVAAPCADPSSSTDFSSTVDTSTPSPPCDGACAAYAAWRARNLPAMILDVGFAARTFASPLGTRTGTVTHEMQSFSYRVVGPAAQAAAPLDEALVGQLRVSVPLRYHLYVGGELELGALTNSAAAAEMTSEGALAAPTIDSTSTLVAGGVAVAGIGGRIGGVDLGIEVAGGVRAVSYAYESHYLACDMDTSVSAFGAVLEGRARASVWLSPHVSLSATAGQSAIDGGVIGGLSVGFTNHAFARR